MKNFLKRISLLLVALCMLAGFGALAACGEEDPGDKITYTATVTLEDGTPVEGVKVSWDDNGPYTTNAQGVATAQLESGTYTVTLDESSLPEGCSVSGPARVTAKAPKSTFVLTSSSENAAILYTVTVLLPDGSGVAGCLVELCISGENGLCIPFTTLTDANGKTSQKIDPENYHAKIISGLPAGYTYNQDASGYYTDAEATPESPSVTIQLKAQ